MSANVAAKPEPVFQILSLSGGGFLGLYTAALIADIEERIGSPFATRFDLLAGTSIGGIVALALAAEVPASKITEAFQSNGKRIFGDSPAPRSSVQVAIDFFRKLRSSKYDSDALRATVAEIVGEGTKIGDLKHPVIVPAINLSRGSPQLFKTPHHETLKLDLNLSVTDVAMATSAAPTYFPIATIDDSQYADGGLFANSPDLLALHEATQYFGVTEDNVQLLSIGTTTAKFSFAHTDEPRFGIWQWFRGARLINITIASQQQIVHSMLTHRLGDRYLRIDQDQSKEQEQVLGLDIATNQAQRTIAALARGTFQAVVNNPVLTKMLAHKAQTPRFYNSRRH